MYAVCWCGTDMLEDLVLLLGTPPQRGLGGLRSWQARSGMSFERERAREGVRLAGQVPCGRRDVQDILEQEYVEAPVWNPQMKNRAEVQATLLSIHQEVVSYKTDEKCCLIAT